MVFPSTSPLGPAPRPPPHLHCRTVQIFADRVLRTPSLQSGREDLVNRAILRQDFARFLWNLEDQQEVKQAALQSILVEIGVAIPLPLDENRNGIEAAESKEEPHPGQEQDGSPSDDDSGDLLVIMRLQAADATTQANLEGARAAYDRGSNRTKRRILKAMFKFDHGGAPHGLPERVMALCHKIGMLSPGARWRLGGLFILHERLQPEENDEHKHCAVIVEYDKKLKVLSIEALGQSEREFEALRFVISAVFHIARDFPGVGWTAWLECGMAHGEKMYHLATSYGKEVSRHVSASARHFVFVVISAHESNLRPGDFCLYGFFPGRMEVMVSSAAHRVALIQP